MAITPTKPFSAQQLQIDATAIMAAIQNGYIAITASPMRQQDWLDLAGAGANLIGPLSDLSANFFSGLPATGFSWLSWGANTAALVEDYESNITALNKATLATGSDAITATLGLASDGATALSMIAQASGNLPLALEFALIAFPQFHLGVDAPEVHVAFTG